ncbi:MAG: ubiquinone biosynthesis protein [Alphaproteobacteria bacterium]|nr:ubiquinone biosynthesis protein [Alphaproteobacteria bacterium]
MEAAAPAPLALKPRRDWKAAFTAMRKLLADPNDTPQVFKIMQALNADVARRNYQRLLHTPGGGRIAYRREELVNKLMNREWLAQFAPGTVGAAYRGFLEKTGYSADGLAQISREQHGTNANLEHPYAWFGRRERDIHDIWHVLTGYQADDPLGELCLVAFSYAQTRGLGWGFIALMGALKSLREQHGKLVRRAVLEGYRNGKAASWLHAEDIDALFAEPLDAARKRLNIPTPVAYRAAKDAFAAVDVSAVAVAAE